MEYRKFGRTNISASIIGIGGEVLEKFDYNKTQELIDYAMNKGINIFDIYNSNPNTRLNIGKALSSYDRDSYIIEGHLGSVWDDGQYRRSRDIDEVKAAYNEFLQLMQIEYVDIGMIHYVDEQKDFDEVFNGEIIKYALELKNKGIIKNIGLSTHNVEIGIQAVESKLIDVILFSINPAYDMLPASEDVNELFEDDAFENVTYHGIDKKREYFYHLCEKEGVALTVMKAYGAGILLDAKQSPFKTNMTPVQCLSYCLDRPGVACVMVGVGSIEHIEQALHYLNASVLEKDYSLLLASAPKATFSGQCMYCGHCAPCIKRIDVASVNKYLDLALIQEELPETIREHYNLLEHHAGECVECGRCMQNCPFGVDIISKMKKAVELFGK